MKRVSSGSTVTAEVMSEKICGGGYNNLIFYGMYA